MIWIIDNDNDNNPFALLWLNSYSVLTTSIHSVFTVVCWLTLQSWGNVNQCPFGLKTVPKPLFSLQSAPKRSTTLQLLRVSYCAFILFTLRICLSSTGQQPTIITLSVAATAHNNYFSLIICFALNKSLLCFGAWSDWDHFVSAGVTVCFLVSAVLVRGPRKSRLHTVTRMKSLFRCSFT